jgi:hypothetical protein
LWRRRRRRMMGDRGCDFWLWGRTGRGREGSGRYWCHCVDNRIKGGDL